MTKGEQFTRVWTTLITNSDYLPGVLTLNYSLKRVHSKYPLVALYTNTFPKDALQELIKRDIQTIEIKDIHPENSSEYTNDPRFADCWSKLKSFSLYQYEKIVQLDSDMVVLHNMDELFDIELNGIDRVFAAGHACVCNPYQKDHYPKDWIPSNCAFTDYCSKQYIKIDDYDNDDNDINVNDVLGPHPINTALKLCNGGLLVIKPDETVYNKILAKLAEDVILDYKFPDQDLLSDLFYENWIGISYIYNYLKTLKSIHQDLDFNKVKNIHYIITPKPWNVSREFKDETGTFEYWFDINDERIAYEEANINEN